MIETIKKGEDKRKKNIKLYFERQQKIEQNVVMISVNRQNQGKKKIEEMERKNNATVENRKTNEEKNTKKKEDTTKKREQAEESRPRQMAVRKGREDKAGV